MIADFATMRKQIAPVRSGAPWVNRVPVDFVDSRKNGGIGHRFGWMLLVLEGYCRARAFCWVGNAELAAAFGCGATSLKALLREMEAAGLVHRVPTEEGRQGRAGIVLLRRANPDLPVADRESIPHVVALMRGRKTDPSAGGKPTPARGPKTDPGIRTLSLKEDEVELGPGDGEDSTLQRQRQEPDAGPFPMASVVALAEAIGAERGAMADLLPTLAGSGPVAVAEAVQPVAILPQADPQSSQVEPTPVAESRNFRDLPAPASGAEATAIVLPIGNHATCAKSHKSSPGVAKANQGTRTDIRPMLDEGYEPVDTLSELAKIAGVSRETVRKVEATSAEGMTPGLAAWVASLPPEKRSVYDGLSPGRKAMVHARRPHGVCADPMLLRMEEADLAPRRPVAAFKPVQTVEDAVEAIVAGSVPATKMLATLLAREFADQKSWPFFDRIGGLLLEYPASAAGFLDALRQARNPGAKNPGAVLVHALKRDHGW